MKKQSLLVIFENRRGTSMTEKVKIVHYEPDYTSAINVLEYYLNKLIADYRWGNDELIDDIESCINALKKLGSDKWLEFEERLKHIDEKRLELNL